MLNSATKTPEEVKNYTIDWSCDLQTGETITGSMWSVNNDLIVGNPASEFDETTTTVYLSAGSSPNTYIVRNVITTSASNTLEKSFNCFVSLDNYL